MRNNKGFSLVELLITLTIISILAMIAVPAYVGQQRGATRSEAYQNLSALRLFEEQFFSENAVYTANAGNVAAIQGMLPGFRPGNDLKFSYAIVADVDIDSTPQIPCFTATATGEPGTRVAGETFAIDCNNNKDF